MEECIEALAEKHETPQLVIGKRKRRDARLLGQAATDLSGMLGEERIKRAWAVAYDMCVGLP